MGGEREDTSAIKPLVFPLIKYSCEKEIDV
jgi:hypothetical protein